MVLRDFIWETDEGVYKFGIVSVTPYGTTDEHKYRDEFWGHIATFTEFSKSLEGITVVVDDIEYYGSEAEEAIDITELTDEVMEQFKDWFLENYHDDLCEDEQDWEEIG